jgi:type IV pilus assembly protein PilE
MKLQKGFTLIEVMVVVIIVAILASVAYPSYLDHLMRSKRAAAQGFMMSVANKEEQVMLDYRCYVNVAGNADFPKDPAGVPPGLNLAVPPDVSGHYNIVVVGTCPANAPPTYTITATPTSPAQTKDLKCASLRLDQAGNKTITGTGSVQDCW